MKIVDLGRIDDDILLFGGCYSNLQATSALFDLAQVHGIAPARRIHTGDVVAYCGQPNETIALLRAQCDHAIAGNCEQQLAAGLSDCGCGFDTGSTCDILSVGWYGYVSRVLTPQNREWMARLPDWIVFTHHNRRYCVVHGSPNHVSEFIWSVESNDKFERQFDYVSSQIGAVDTIVSGHSGIAFCRDLSGNRQWLNAGVIGMPPNNGMQDTQFVTLKQGQFSIHTLTYDAHTAADAMHLAGLTQGYDRALINGYWPSEDVLPPELRVSDKG